MTASHPSTKERTLQQQVMSFISAGVNTGLWNRDIAYDLVRQMLDAQWNYPHDMRAEAKAEGQCEAVRADAIECLRETQNDLQCGQVHPSYEDIRCTLKLAHSGAHHALSVISEYEWE